MANPNADPNNPASFSPSMEQVREGAQQPYVHPSLQGSPEALAYAIGAAARRGGGLPKYNAPTPGAGPAMPPLDAPHQSGLTIEQQAGFHGQTHAQQAQQAARTAGSIVDGGARPVGIGSMQPGAARPAQPSPAQMGILQTDMLPQEAMNDPNFIRGQGAMFAANQPNMALRYGVVRNGQHVPPQALQANVGGAGQSGQIGNRPLSQTLQDLQNLSSVQQPKQVHDTEEEAEKEAATNSAASSANAGKPAEQPFTKEDIENVIKKMDDFDYASFRKQLMHDQLNNPEQRLLIESRLEELSLDELIMKDRVTQRVPVIPDRFEIVFQSMTGDEDLALKRLLMKESTNVEVTDKYVLDKFALMALTAGLYKLNKNPVPSHLNEKGLFDEKLFWAKFDWVLKRPLHMLASIGCNHTWFEIRVRKLFVAEKVKNG
jgi:hypothetical protein